MVVFIDRDKRRRGVEVADKMHIAIPPELGKFAPFGLPHLGGTQTHGAGKGGGGFIECIGGGGEECGCDSFAPIDDCAKDVEEECFGGIGC